MFRLRRRNRRARLPGQSKDIDPNVRGCAYERRYGCYSNEIPVHDESAQETVLEIFVGAERKQFNIHKDILTGESKYFETMLQRSWQETAEGTLSLEEIEPQTFQLFVDWLYKGKDIAMIFFGGLSIRYEMMCKIVGFNADDLSVAKAIVMADYIRAMRFRNDLVTYWAEYYSTIRGRHSLPFANRVPAAETIAYVYANTAEDSQIRYLLVNIFAAHGTLDDIKDPGLQDIPEFLLDLDEERKTREKIPVPQMQTLPLLSYSDGSGFVEHRDWVRQPASMRVKNLFCVMFHDHRPEFDPLDTAYNDSDSSGSTFHIRL